MIRVTAVRMWIMDRTPSDNPLSGDLEFTDDEIQLAMAHAAREFNSLPPLCMFADPSNLPDDTNVFFEAIAECLYKMLLHKLRRNAFEYRGGNVQVDDDKVKIGNLEKMVAELSKWRETAHHIKQTHNIQQFFTTLGAE